MIIKLNKNSLKKLDKEVKKLQKKFMGTECWISCEVISSEFVENDNNTFTELTLCEIDYEIPSNEYKILAKIDHTTNPNIIFAFDENLDINEYAHIESECDHCNSKRKRNFTYIIESKLNFTRVQVGSTCINDFFLNAYIQKFLTNLEFFFETFETFEEEKSPYGANHFVDTKEFTRYVIEFVLQKVYTKTEKNFIYDDYKKNIVLDDSEEGKKYFDKFFSEEFLEELEKENNVFANNLKAILSAEYSHENHIMLLIGCIAYRILQDRQRATETVKVSNYIGNIKDKLKMTLTVTYKSFYDDYSEWNRSGYGTCLVFEDAEGNKLVNFDPNNRFEDMYAGDKVIATFKVKDHSEYKGTKQTIINWLKIQEFIEKVEREEPPQQEY